MLDEDGECSAHQNGRNEKWEKLKMMTEEKTGACGVRGGPAKICKDESPKTAIAQFGQANKSGFHGAEEERKPAASETPEDPGQA